MKLLRLELTGFKSFPKKTSLEFHEGITAIVGPNGCGKSNFVDAIRWVLGEQNPRMLRGERMDDAIFKGTATRKPLGLAEVTITLSNEDGDLPIPYSEVSLTRRLHKSGESQYLINKNQVRLKDIIDLTSGTGIGLIEYSLIDQKLVDMILDESTNNRRDLLEEAAGVAGYKRKRHLARKKLEAVQMDLSRLGDIISEVERNVGSLGRHVKKAKRYQTYRQRQRELDIELTTSKLSRLSLERDDVTQRLDHSEEQVGEQKVLVEQRSRQIADTREIAENLEEETRKRRIEIDTSQARRSELDGDQRLARERLRLSRERVSRLGSEREDLREKRASLVREKKLVEEKVSAVLAELALAEEGHGEQEKKTELLTQQLEEKKSLLSSVVRTLEEEYRESMREEARQISLGEEIGGLKKRQFDLEPLLTGETGEVERIVLEEGGLSKEIEQLTEIVSKMQAELRSTEEKRHELLVNRDTYSRKERENELALNNVNARMDALKHKDHGQAVDRAIEYALDLGRESGIPVWKVSEILELREGHLEILNNFRLGFEDTIVTKDLDTALEMIHSLKDNQFGAVSIVPLEGILPTTDEIPEAVGAERASNFVMCNERFVSLKEYLLGNIFFVPHDTDIRDLVLLSRDGRTFVARDSSFMIRHGTLTIGKATGKQHDSIEELEVQGEELMQKLSEAHTELDSVEAVLLDIDRDKSQLEIDVQGRKNSLQGKETRAHQISVEISSRKSAEVRLRFEQNTVISLREEKEALLRTFEESIGDRSSRLEGLEKNRVDLTGELEFISESERAERGILNNLKVDVAALSSRLGEVRILDGNLGSQIEGIDGELKAKDDDETSLFEKIASLETGIGDLENGLEFEKAKIENMAADLEKMEEELRRKRRRAEEVGEGVEEMRDSLEKIYNERNDLSVRKKELDITIESLVNRIRDEYNVTLEPDRTVAEPDEKNLTKEQGNLEELEAELADIKRKIHYMGSVNMAALEEYESEKERYDFLTSQRDDLVRSKEDLEKTIRKLNRVARDLFRDTFTDVQRNFSRIFSTLFRGGEAGLELSDETDQLESDINIFARPKGKKEQAIELLSGGERALSAIAFLFSLYLVKSSPFCIFDEVDAPLDDPNIVRFTSMLKEYSSNTQFVIITHNKRTMEAADYMFGVSMEEPGISKVVSIKLNGNGRNKEGQEPERIRIVDRVVV